MAVFFGAVGQDKYSEILKLKANEDGLDVKYQYSAEKPTGKQPTYLLLLYCRLLKKNNLKMIC